MHAYTRVRDHERVPIFLCLPVYLLYSNIFIVNLNWQTTVRFASHSIGTDGYDSQVIKGIEFSYKNLWGSSARR